MHVSTLIQTTSVVYPKSKSRGRGGGATQPRGLPTAGSHSRGRMEVTGGKQHHLGWEGWCREVGAAQLELGSRGATRWPWQPCSGVGGKKARDSPASHLSVSSAASAGWTRMSSRKPLGTEGGRWGRRGAGVGEGRGRSGRGPAEGRGEAQYPPARPPRAGRSPLGTRFPDAPV